MNNKNLIDIITSDVAEVTNIVNQFRKFQKIPPIFIDLALSKVRNLYVELNMLNKNNAQLLSIGSNDQFIRKNPIVEKDFQKDDILDVNEQSVFDDMQHSWQQQSETDMDHAGATLAKDVEETEETFYSDQKPALIKLLEDDIAEIQERYPKITDIATAVDLNEKIWFTKELFGGDVEVYNAGVEALNKMNYLEEALDYIQHYYSWDFNNKTTRRFMQLVYRRFA